MIDTSRQFRRWKGLAPASKSSFEVALACCAVLLLCWAGFETHHPTDYYGSHVLHLSYGKACALAGFVLGGFLGHATAASRRNDEIHSLRGQLLTSWRREGAGGGAPESMS